MNISSDAERVRNFELKMRKVAEDLSRIEGVEWSFQLGNWERYCVLSSPGLELSVQLYRDGYSASAKDRIAVVGQWPERPRGGRLTLREARLIDYNAQEPKITVSADLSVNRIAKDIKRRLIDGENLRDLYAKVVAYIEHERAYYDRKRTLAEELFKLAGQKFEEDRLTDRDPVVRLYEYAPGVSYGDLRVTGDDSVRLELSIDGELAAALLNFLNARRMPGTARHAGAL